MLLVVMVVALLVLSFVWGLPIDGDAAIEILSKTTSTRTPVYATAVNNLGVSLSKLKQHERALPLLLEAYDIRNSILGPDSSDTAGAAASVAGVLNWLDRCGCVHASYR